VSDKVVAKRRRQIERIARTAHMLKGACVVDIRGPRSRKVESLGEAGREHAHA